jgi:hypothetical protein
MEPNGSRDWNFQPLPYMLDDDPDWNAGATLMQPFACGSNANGALGVTGLGNLVASVMKDGWTYAVDSNSGRCVWQFPDMGNLVNNCTFPDNDSNYHGSEGFRVPGAAWGNVLVIAAGGYALPYQHTTTDAVLQGKLTGLDVCALDAKRNTMPHVRWIADVPHASPIEDALGAPTIIGGIIYVGTDQGWVEILADPAVYAPTASICDDARGHSDSSSCSFYGGEMVPAPTVLREVNLNQTEPDGTSTDARQFRKEVVIAEGLAFISTTKCIPSSNGSPCTKFGYLHALGFPPGTKGACNGNCPKTPACSASTDCSGNFKVSCSGQNLSLSFSGSCPPVSGGQCSASCTGSPCSLNVDWIGAVTSPDGTATSTLQACADNTAGASCSIVTASATGCFLPPPPNPKCFSGLGSNEFWCPKLKECLPASVYNNLCLITPAFGPTPQPVR